MDDAKQQIEGTEAITYFNQSPDPLDYLWLQLDQNFRAQDSETPLVTANFMKDSLSSKDLFTIQNNFDGGFRIDEVLDEDQQEEIHEYFLEEAETPDIDVAMEEFDGDYEEEELRLYRIKFFSEIAN